jgi:peroxiredoxin
MKKFLLSTALVMMTSGAALAAPVIGEPAPAFTATDINGVEHSLSDFQGKTVVLEWNNPQCPYVLKHYESGNMQQLQSKATEDDVVWLTINSGAEGNQGYMTDEEAQTYVTASGAAMTAYFNDPSGELGRLYDAKVTPHMYVVNSEGTLVYNGAIDSDSSFKPETIEGATNYVMAAINDLKAGSTVQTAETQAYGCSVKY